MERPTGVLSLRAALALCGQAIEPPLDIGDPKSVKPQRTEARLDVVLHMALVSGVRQWGKIRSNRVFEPSMEELPNCRHPGDDRLARGLARELHPSAVDDLTGATVDVFALTLA